MGRATPLSYFNAKQLVELLIARVPSVPTHFRATNEPLFPSKPNQWDRYLE